MAELNVVVFDGYDREVFERALARHEGLRAISTRLARVLPHPENLLLDVFCCLFKLTTVLRVAKELSASALINHGLVKNVLASPNLESLRRSTELDEPKAAMATLMLAERILEGLKMTFKDQPRELLNTLETARDEETLNQKRRESEHLKEIDVFDEASKDALDEELDDDIEDLEARLLRHRKRQTKTAKTFAEIAESVTSEIDVLPDKLTEIDQLARDFTPGAGAGVSAEQRLELGQRIMQSRNLKRLARLLGAFREVAAEARRKKVVQAPQETHSVSLGAELEHLLPAEMLGLRNHTGSALGTALRLDFLRKFTEKQLLQYRLQAPASRGPIVVCLDGSGSMQGSKELWGKAVALTLMDIARRERRRCLAIIFSCGEALFEIDLLQRRRVGERASVDTDELLRFAEHFPAGGTDFEPPLERAIEAVTAGDHRRGDVVFITDGFAPVSDTLVARIDRERRRHRFKIRAILVDAGEHEKQSVARFADEVRLVSDLAADSLVDIFEVL